MEEDDLFIRLFIKYYFLVYISFLNQYRKVTLLGICNGRFILKVSIIF